jgi:hypothetical protein
MVNQRLPSVLRRHWSINVDIMLGRTSQLASSYGRKVKPPIMMQISSPTQRRKYYEER